MELYSITKIALHLGYSRLLEKVGFVVYILTYFGMWWKHSPCAKITQNMTEGFNKDNAQNLEDRYLKQFFVDVHLKDNWSAKPKLLNKQFVLI